MGIQDADPTVNVHHVYFKTDKNRLPRGFKTNDRSNLVVLPTETHETLHDMIDNSGYLQELSLRVYLANMAFIEELDLVPQREYHQLPKTRKPPRF